MLGSWDLLVPSLPAAPHPFREEPHPLDIRSFLLVPGIQLALASIPYKIPEISGTPASSSPALPLDGEGLGAHESSHECVQEQGSGAQGHL